jgi:tetratricopeptide (TPR) repeat protein
MMKDDTRKRRLPAGFGRRVLVRLIEEGRKDLLAMRYDRARARFQEAVDAAPESPEALLALGSAYDPLAGAGPQDVEVLERAAAAAPASIPVLCALAAARWQRGPEEAYRPVFRRCMDLCDHRLAANPKDAEALKARAELLRMEGDHAGAEEALRTAAGERPADQEALYLLALSMDRQGRHDEAFPVYEQVYALNPGTFWAYGSLRQRAQDLAFRKGDARQAVALMEKVWRLTRRPHEAENLLYFYSGTGQWQKAVALFESAKDPFHHPRTFATVGIGYMEQGNLDKAQDVLAQALHLAAEPAFRAEIQFHRALILFALGKNADARSVLGEGLRLDPAARSVALTGAPASVFWRPWTMRLTQTLERLAGYDARAEPLLEGVQHLRR